MKICSSTLEVVQSIQNEDVQVSVDFPEVKLMTRRRKCCLQCWWGGFPAWGLGISVVIQFAGLKRSLVHAPIFDL